MTSLHTCAFDKCGDVSGEAAASYARAAEGVEKHRAPQTWVSTIQVRGPQDTCTDFAHCRCAQLLTRMVRHDNCLKLTSGGTVIDESAGSQAQAAKVIGVQGATLRVGSVAHEAQHSQAEAAYRALHGHKRSRALKAEIIGEQAGAGGNAVRRKAGHAGDSLSEPA